MIDQPTKNPDLSGRGSIRSNATVLGMPSYGNSQATPSRPSIASQAAARPVSPSVSPNTNSIASMARFSEQQKRSIANSYMQGPSTQPSPPIIKVRDFNSIRDSFLAEQAKTVDQSNAAFNKQVDLTGMSQQRNGNAYRDAQQSIAQAVGGAGIPAKVQAIPGAEIDPRAQVRTADPYYSQTPDQFRQTIIGALSGYEGSNQQQHNLGLRLNGEIKATGVPTAAPGISRYAIPGSKAPLYSNNQEDPLGGMNTKPGINGQAGNVSTVGIDKAAIERGMAADRDLHNARIEAMDGRAPVEGGRVAAMGGDGIMGGTPEWMRPGYEARASLSEMAARSPRAKYRAQAAQALASIDSQQEIAQGNQAVAREGQQNQMSISQANNDAYLQRQLLDQQQKSPGLDLDNKSKSMTIAGQQQQADLQNKYLALNDTSDPSGTQRRSIASQLLTMQGKTVPDKYKVVEVGGGEDSDGRKIPKNAYLLDQNTGQYQPFGKQSVTPLQNHVDALVKDPSLAAKFDATYGAGASQQYLKG